MTDNPVTPVVPIDHMAKLVASLQAIRGKAQQGFVDAFSDEDSGFNADKLAREVSSMLIQERRQLVYALLGVDTSWSRIEIKKRGSNDVHFPISQNLETMAKNAVIKFFDENKDYVEAEVAKMVGNTKITKALRNEFKSMYEYRVKEHMRELASSAARKDAEAMHREIMTALSLKPKDE